ncbi:MAG TPA: hypothetical protein VFO24_03405 [Usitatibacter sp.]|nr:hypothetical protein [Usitatibacter sp.]
MRPKTTFSFLASAALLAASWLCAGAAGAAIGPADAQHEGAQLRERFARMQSEIAASGFGQPLRLVSADGDHVLKGDVYALVDHPFGEVEAALHEPDQWCQVLVLPFNVKRCDARGHGDGSGLSIFIARKAAQSADHAFRADFRFRVEALAAGYMRIALRADSGPLGTRDYRIVLEAAPRDGAHTIVHLSYSYGYGMMSQVAMQAYLATAGADKVGFTVERRDAGGKPVYVGGMRGVMERNTMRYFLAIDAYLDSLSAPAASRIEARLAQWFDTTERYPRQLHEMERDDYVAMKRREARAGSAPEEGPG